MMATNIFLFMLSTASRRSFLVTSFTTSTTSITASSYSLIHKAHIRRSSSSSSSSTTSRLFLSTRTTSTTEENSSTAPPLETKKTAILWLQSSLRIQDNKALFEAATTYGSDGLAILYTWKHGLIPQTPSAVFECAAVHAFNQTLRDLFGNDGNQQQQCFSVIYADNDKDALSKVAKIVEEIQPTTVVVDAKEYSKDVIQLEQLLSSSSSKEQQQQGKTKVVSIKDNNLLMPFYKVRSALGRSRGGGRVLRWSTYLSQMANQEYEEPKKEKLVALPPPLLILPKEQEEEEKTSQKATLLLQPLPSPSAAGKWAEQLLEQWGEITEKEALHRASSKTTHTNHHHYYNDTQLGQGSSNKKAPKDTRLSPYLRWGMISPRQAAQAGGVRKRDLLWRDWSYVCYTLLRPLQRGDAVVQLLDGCCCSTTTTTTTTTTEEEEEENEENKEKDTLFKKWCVGNTGSPIVDAGMRQLWIQGWMLRHVRLLVASCLVEGYGVDWKKGRDWFEHTLIDYDVAINEMMWQNAGLCGVDPFYRGLKWENKAVYNESDEEYVQTWARKELIYLPRELKHYFEMETMKYEDVVEIASRRRKMLSLSGVYKAASRVANSGVRVSWPGNVKSHVEDGEVWGIGRTPIQYVEFETE